MKFESEECRSTPTVSSPVVTRFNPRDPRKASYFKRASRPAVSEPTAILPAFGRRAFLATAAGPFLRAANPKSASLVVPPQHFLDRATELDLYRLTDPRFTSCLPPPHLRSISRKSRFLIACSDRSGSMQAWQVDWHSGATRQITSATQFQPDAVALTSDDRGVIHFDGPALREINVGSSRQHELARVREGWDRVSGFAANGDGSLLAWIERQADQWELRVLHSTQPGGVQTVLHSQTPLTAPEIRPKTAQILVRQQDGESLNIIDAATSGVLPVQVNAGTVKESLWSPDGASLLYLSVPSDPKQLTTLREYLPDTRADRLVAKTSQFASFGVNSDGSVFAGASRSIASPYLLLLLRITHRELTLCEHRCSQPRLVNPVFSPDSQNVFFVSDRHGKPAIYRVRVDRFVEQTEPGT